MVELKMSKLPRKFVLIESHVIRVFKETVDVNFIL